MYMGKRRTQLYLDERQRQILEREASLSGKSLGQLVREAIDQVYVKAGLSEESIDAEDPLWKLAGAGDSGQKDISRRHDEYLYR